MWAVASVLLLAVSVPLAWLQVPFPHPEQAFGNHSVLEMLWYPIEVNGPMRLQSAPGAIYGVTVGAARTWAVGDGGLILVTTDHGQSWRGQASGTRAALRDVEFQADGQQGWAVGDGGIILATADGGESWTAQTSGTQADLRALQFQADGQHGWAVGKGGTILETTDRGQSWRTQTVGALVDLKAVQFQADGQHGWTVGDGGTVLATTDGGGSWTAQTSGPRESLRALQFQADGKHGWTVGTGGTILATADGGESWTAQTSGTKESLRALQFQADGQHGWAVGGGGTILATVDGGLNWAAQTSGTQSFLLAVQFQSDGQLGWALGSYGTILATANGGGSWTAQASGSRGTLNAVQFAADGQHGWAVGGGGTILATADGGESWTAQTSGTQANLIAVQFGSDGQHGWTAGEGGTILATADGGESWTPQTSPTQGDINALRFQADGRHGWAVDDNGPILVTADGGESWTVQTTAESGLWSIWLQADGQHGWAVGNNGTILATADGGVNWVVQTRGAAGGKELHAVQFAADGQHGWVVGANGAILATADGGLSWAAQTSGTQATLWGVHFQGDGQHGWAAGVAGEMLSTRDGGKRWVEIDSRVGSSRLGVWADKTGSTIWAPGYSPALLLLRSSDGGKTWEPHPQAWPLRYSRYPALWFWMTLLFAGWLWTRSFGFGRREPEGSAEAAGFTDAPTASFEQDRLRFGPLAKGISRFLRNVATEPPLTLAISGDWGSGKSSLMALICADLRRYGTRPVWFNAWHHQDDQQLLAGLLSAIRDQALPSSLTPDGWAFRLRLLWLRSKKHFALVFVLIALASGVIAFLIGHDLSAWDRMSQIIQGQLLWINAAANGDQATISKADLAKLLAPLASVIATFIAAGKALTAFGTNPAVLLSTTAEKFRLKDATARTNFLARFAEQFREVTEALPQRMVIVIDDVDRCRSESVLDVMEAANFLVSSGSCFIIFGMAMERVQAALALSFDKIATEMADLNKAGEQLAEEGKTEAVDRAARQQYARDYLEKLVNIEIVLPTIGDVDASRLFDRSETNESALWLEAWKPVARLWPVILAMVAIFLGGNFGWRLVVQNPPPEVVIQPQPAAVATVQSPDASPVKRLAPTSTVTPAVQRYVPAVQPGDPHSIDWLVFALSLASLAACFAAFTLYRLRKAVHQVRDTRSFQDALRAWAPLVHSHRATPRAIKRFGNRIRYLVMLHQPERLDDSGFDTLRRIAHAAFAWIRSHVLRAQTSTPATGPIQRQDRAILDMAEENIVALGALNECFGPQWRNCATGIYSSSVQQQTIELILRSLKSSSGQLLWPPSKDELDSFEASLRGVRMPSS
jgi:photosystem II stability/assembly factor-like uncharacterized protein